MLPQAKREPRARRRRDGADRVWVSRDDQELLRWYYRTGGLGHDTASATARAIALLEQRRRVAVACRRCGGDPATDRPGTGFVDSATGRAPERPSEGQTDLLALLEIELPQLGDAVCPSCGGRGWRVGARSVGRARQIAALVPPLSPFRLRRTGAPGTPTAWPTSASHEGQAAAVERSVVSLARLGEVSRRLRAVREGGELGRLCELALEAYFSPDGGSIAALWHLTPAGRTMLRHNPHKLSPAQLFANLRNEQRDKRNPSRQAQFDAADEQSRALLARACSAWNETAPPHRPRGETRAAAHERRIRLILGDLEIDLGPANENENENEGE